MIKNVRVQTKDNKAFKLGNKQIFSVPALKLLTEETVNKLNANEIFNLIRKPQVQVFEVSDDLTQELKLTLDNYMIKNIFVSKAPAKPVKARKQVVPTPVEEPIKETGAPVIKEEKEEPVKEEVTEETVEEVTEEVVEETEETTEEVTEETTEVEEPAKEVSKEEDTQHQQYKKNNKKKKNK